MKLPEIKFHQLLENSILDFEKKQISFGRLVNDIESLIENVDYPDEWKELFRSEWWTLEQIYTVALDRGEEIKILC